MGTTRFGFPIADHTGAKGVGAITSINSGVFQAAEDAMLEGIDCILSSTLIADTSLDAPTVYPLYTVPAGKKAILRVIILHSNSASLAGMIDVNFGGGVAAITPMWINAVDFSTMTTVNSALISWASAEIIMIDGDDVTEANRTLNMEVVSGSTAAGTAIVSVFGFLV